VRIASLALAAGACWLAAMLALPRLVSLPGPVTVIAADGTHAVLAVAAAGLPLQASAGRAAVTARPAPADVERLYRAGAWLVLPGGLPGCRGVPPRGQPAVARQAS
jgi:hypothetical protein